MVRAQGSLIQIGISHKDDTDSRDSTSGMNDTFSDAPAINFELYNLLAKMRSMESS